MSSRLVAGLPMGAALAAAVPAAGDPIADFYKGRTIDLIIAYKPGGGYDAYARLAGRHIGRHSPGDPQVVPQNMPLAGGLKAANYLYEVAKRDAYDERIDAELRDLDD